MVTSLKASEKNVGNHGSKSVFDLKIGEVYKSSTVKEQRVYGSNIRNPLNSLMLRCTLKGFERSYQVRIPSNHPNNLIFYSTSSSILYNSQKAGYTLKPYFVTSFTDA